MKTEVSRAGVESETAREQRIERLVREIQQVIEEADPRQRSELRQMASDLLQEESLDEAINEQQSTAAVSAGRPLTMLTFGIAILALGAVLFFLVPFIGLFMMIAGAGSIGLSLAGRFIPLSFSKLRRR
jgi:hypothetical protein